MTAIVLRYEVQYVTYEEDLPDTALGGGFLARFAKCVITSWLLNDYGLDTAFHIVRRWGSC